jgi:hypothetical protein
VNFDEAHPLFKIFESNTRIALGCFEDEICRGVGACERKPAFIFIRERELAGDGVSLSSIRFQRSSAQLEKREHLD